ncbi:MAG: DUF4350 domain-containing protein [Verrucomicrobia bacterium]|nr:DUF4350 domain-containing protein [Verrucomicrobiota bacterium]
MKHITTLCGLIVLIAGVGTVMAQQVADLSYRPPIPHPAYPTEKGPRIGIDEAHNNFHTANGRYKPFAELLRRDGYRVGRLRKSLSAKSLEDVDVVVIANPLHKQNNNNWKLPTPSAFSKEEIAALHTWVEEGGSLFLIADHMPFPGGARRPGEGVRDNFQQRFCQTGKLPARKPRQIWAKNRTN